jgi:AcrR family transcriptional regulator
VTRGAVYWHFRDKAALFDAMQIRAKLPQKDVINHLLSEEDATPEALERLGVSCREILHTMVADERRRRVYTILLFRCEYGEEMRHSAERMRENNRQMKERLTRFFELSAQRGTLSRAWPPQAATLALDGLMFGLINRLLQTDEPREALGGSQACVDSFFRSLAEPAQAAAQEPENTGRTMERQAT